MKYLSNAINFAVRNWTLIIPLFVLTALASLIKGAGTAVSFATLLSLLNPNNYMNIESILNMIWVFLAAVTGSSIVSFIVQFIHQPATYGLVHKGLETGNVSLNDIGAAISGNFVKYIMYFLGNLIVSVVIGLAAFVILLIMSLFTTVLKAFGVILTVLVILALFIFLIAFDIFISLWFTAMVVDGFDLVNAFKKSVEIVKSCFWIVLGVTLLVTVAARLVSFILSFLNFVPLIGPVILSVIPSIQMFVMIIFRLMIYRDKTGRDYT